MGGGLASRLPVALPHRGISGRGQSSRSPEVIARHRPRLGRHAAPARADRVLRRPLDLMLTGKSVDSKKAGRIGLADDCVPRGSWSRWRASWRFGAKLLPDNCRRRSATRWAMNGPPRKMVADKARVQAAQGQPR